MTTRRATNTIVLAGVLLAWGRCALALNPALEVNQYAHTTWLIRDGFIKGLIRGISQGPDGYLWLATEFGVVRFDGITAVPWEPPGDERLPSSDIWSVLAARDGSLWIGTSKGLVRWKAGKLGQYAELSGKFVPKLFEDRRGTVWAAGQGIPSGILCAIRDRDVACDSKDGRFAYSPWGFYEDRKGNFWVGATGGLWKWWPEPRAFFAVPEAKDDIQGFAEDAEGALLFTTRSGVRRVVGESIFLDRTTTSPQALRSSKLLRDRDGSLWIGTTNDGLLHVYQGRTDHFGLPDGLSGQDVSGLLEDREGNIWVITENGLDRFRDVAVSRLSVKQGIPAGVNAVALASDAGIWLTDSLGLAKWRNGSVLAYTPPGAERRRSGTRDLLVRGSLRGGVASVFEDDRQRTWLASSTTFGYLRDDTFVEVPGVAPRQVRTIAEDTRGNVWVADQEGGLLRVSAGGQVVRSPWSELGHTDFATAMAADRMSGGLWLGFFNGGVAYVEDGKILESYGPADGLTIGWVKGLQIGADHAVWVAAEGGLSRLHDGHITTLSHQNGLPCDPVNWVIGDDDGSLWLNMPCGLVRITRQDVDGWASGRGQSVTSTVFDTADGVRNQSTPAGYSPFVVKAADGRLWFVGLDGVNVLDPRHLPFNAERPPVHVERIVADRQSYDADALAGHLRLPALTRDLQIDYTALSLVVPEKNRFRTMLEGWDRDWQDVGTRRQAFYSNLPPRSYRFRVIASNNSGVWNDAGSALEFSIAPAYYQTRWFMALSVIAVVTVAFGAHRIRLRIVEKHEGEISALNERLMKAQEQERIRIAGELHDGVMQEMLAMTMMLGSAKRRIGDPAAAQATIEKIQDKTIRIGNDIRRLSHDLHPPILQEAGLPKAVESYCEQFSGTSGVRVSCDVDDSASELSRGAALAVFRVMQEALGNAAKHGKATQITVRLTRTNGEVALIVSDNGIGFDPRRVVSGGLGLIMMRERATQLNGTFEFDTAPRRGTTIRMAIPFR